MKPSMPHAKTKPHPKTKAPKTKAPKTKAPKTKSVSKKNAAKRAPARSSFTERWRAKALLPTKFVMCRGQALPVSAAPTLSFDDESDGWWPNARGYRVIGTDGAGNPICIKESKGTVCLLDHGSQFKSEQFVNSGVAELAECLLAYMLAFDGECSSAQLREHVARIDAPALAKKAFWGHEVAALESAPPPPRARDGLKPLLDRFGELLVSQVRDRTLSQRNDAVAREVVDRTLHHLLVMLEEQEAIDVSVGDGKGELIELRSASDGLAGELYGASGWIRRFSQYPPAKA